MIGNKNGDDSMSVNTYSQKPMPIQSPGRTYHSVASQNSYWIINAQNIDILMQIDGYRLTFLHPHDQVDKRYGEIVCDHRFHTLWHPTREDGRVAIEREGGGGGFSGLNANPETDVSRTYPYLTIPYTSQGFQKIISDWMRWITRERAYPEIYSSRHKVNK